MQKVEIKLIVPKVAKARQNKMAVAVGGFVVSLAAVFSEQKHMFPGKLDRFNENYLSNRPQFLGVYRRNKPTRDVGRIREKLVNHESDSRQASDLQAFGFG